MEAIRLSLQLWDENEAEAVVVVAVGGGVVVAIRHSAVNGAVVPTTAAMHAVRTHDYCPCMLQTL